MFYYSFQQFNFDFVFPLMNVLCRESRGERSMGGPFTTVRPVPSDTDEEIVASIADLTQPDEAWSQIFCL